MRKSLLLLILSALILLFSCSSPEPTEPAEPSETPHTTQGVEEPPPSSVAPPPGLLTFAVESADDAFPTEPIEYFEMSDNPFDFTLKIDGDVFMLPMPIEVFLSYGWRPTRELTGVLLPGDDFVFDFGSRFMFTRGDSFISVDIANMSDEVRYISKCTIVGLSTIFTNATIELPHGIRIDTSTMDDVLSAFGEPDDTFDNTWHSNLELSYRYEDSFWSRIQIDIDYENGNVVNRIHITNKVQIDSDLISDMATVYDEVTDKERNYTAPAALGDDLSSFNVEIYGDLYRIPAPVSAFIDNGWELVRDSFWGIPSESIPRKREVSGYYLARGNDELRVRLFNFGDKLLAVERCFVVEFDINVLHGENIRLPGGITYGTTENRLIELFGNLLEDVHAWSPTERQYTFYPDGYDSWQLSEVTFVMDLDESSQTGDEFKITRIRLTHIELD
jgi:hypothetical protein